MTTKIEINPVPEDLHPPTEYIITRQDEAMITGGKAILAVIGLGALAIILLAFQPWVDFGPFETNGIDAEALTGFSDGYVVAVLGCVILAAAAGILLRPRWTFALLPTIAVASVVILLVAGYTVATSWHAVGIDNEGAFIYAGDPTPVPYVIAGIAIAVMVLASILAAIRASRTR